MDALASIVIPLKRQRDEWLDQCVASAIAQSAPCEVIVVCCEATPASNLQILKRKQSKFDNLRVVLEASPGSFPGAINLGIRCASTSRIGLLLSDDWLEPDAVAHCLPLKADIVSTGNTVYFADGVTLVPGASHSPTMAKYGTLRPLDARANYLQHFFLFEKEALIQAGGLDETIGNFPGIDDFDLIWTLLERGASVSIIERSLYNYRDHAGDRLTLADAGQAVCNLEKILRKHRVPEPRLAQLMKGASRWFGRPLHEVLREDAATHGLTTGLTTGARLR